LRLEETGVPVLRSSAEEALHRARDTIPALTRRRRGLIAAPMINAATIAIIARRRRSTAVRADLRV
jgi:hypothetical protein